MKPYLLTFVVSLIFLVSNVGITAQTPRNARVIAEKANLRETPSIVGLAEGEVPEGTVVRVIDEKLPWYVVRVGDRVGWMHGATLQFVLQDELEPPPTRQTAPLNTAPVPVYTPSTKPEPRTPSSSRSGGYILGPRGGCYYISGSGRKVYVDRSLCN